jgi:hypothetical protein
MLACALALCGVAHAQQTPGTAQVGQAAPVGDPIRLKVSVIHAFKSEGLADPKLDKIRGELTEAFAGYKGFKLLQSEVLAIYDPAQPLGALFRVEAAQWRLVLMTVKSWEKSSNHPLPDSPIKWIIRLRRPEKGTP